MPFPTWNTHDLHRYSRALPGVNPTLLWWQAGMKTWETMFAAPQVIAQRTARMAAAGPFPGARDRREFTNMGTEKVIAFSQAWMGAAREIFVWQQEMANVASRQCWELMRAFNPLLAGRGAYTVPAALMSGMVAASKRSTFMLPRVAHSALGPIHARATSNARRLNGRRS